MVPVAFVDETTLDRDEHGLGFAIDMVVRKGGREERETRSIRPEDLDVGVMISSSGGGDTLLMRTANERIVEEEEEKEGGGAGPAYEEKKKNKKKEEKRFSYGRSLEDNLQLGVVLRRRGFRCESHDDGGRPENTKAVRELLTVALCVSELVLKRGIDLSDSLQDIITKDAKPDVFARTLAQDLQHFWEPKNATRPANTRLGVLKTCLKKINNEEVQFYQTFRHVTCSIASSLRQ